MNNRKDLTTPANEILCPADTLMHDFRKEIRKKPISKYSKHINISKSCINYWKKHADIVLDNFDSITFIWKEMPEEDLPPLKIKVKNNNGNYSLMYLKEYGEEKLLIQCTNHKGKNKNGIIYLDKKNEKGKMM